MENGLKNFIKKIRKRIFLFYKRRALRLVTNGIGKIEITDDKIICYVNNDILRRKYEKNGYDISFYGVDSFEPSLIHSYSIDKPVYYIIKNMKFDVGIKVLARNNTCVVFKNCIFKKSINIPWADQVIFENNKYYDLYPIYYPDKKCFFTAHLKTLMFKNEQFTNSQVDHHPTQFGIKADVWNLNIESSIFDDDIKEIDIRSKKINIKDSVVDCSNIIIQSHTISVCDSEIKASGGIIIENKNYDFCGYVDSPFVMYNGVQIVGNESSHICLDQETINLQRTREMLLKQFKNLLDLCYQVDYQKLQNYKEQLNVESVKQKIK